VIDLDDAASVRAADPGGMLEAVAKLPKDCAAGYARGIEVDGLPTPDGVTSVTVCGMGGSAVSGDVMRALFRERLAIPVEVVRSPVLPEYCGPHTLVICSSYSGDTAEALACFEEARSRGCRILPITSGGALGERAVEAGLAVVAVPGELPPRAALGHLAFGMLGALERTGLLPSLSSQVAECVRTLEELASHLGPDVRVPQNGAKELALRIQGCVPVVWGAEGLGSVAAARWKTQLNENAKTPAFWSSMPELDHNEVVGWTSGTGDGFHVVALRHQDEHPDVAARFGLSLEIAGEAGANTSEVRAVGLSPLSRLLSLVVHGDFMSVYLALARGVDPTPVEAIDRLKRSLAGR